MTAKADQKTDAWMPLWIGAYLADTMRLTTIQHGAYLLLLMAYWRDRAPLPDNDEDLRSITKTDKAEWKKLRPTMAAFFRVGDGVWWHKRVEQEIASANARQKAASSKAQAGAQARWKKGSGDAPSNAPSNAQALPKDVPKQCPTPSPSPILGIPTDVVNSETSVCVAVHTHISDEFRAAIQTARPELDADLVYANFVAHYPPAGQTMARWRQWVANERAGVSGVAISAEKDPNTRPNVEARGIAAGIGRWDDCAEQWPQYKARVVAAEVVVVQHRAVAA